MKNKFKIYLAIYLLTVVGILLFINLVLLEGIPHVPDSAAYLFMAKLFAQGKITGTITVPPEHFNFFPGILNVNNGNWLFQYSFGHPLVLLPGVVLGFPNIIPPITGSLFLLFLFLTGKEVYDTRSAIFIIILPLLSPFFLENASEFMSHNTAALFLILGLYLLILNVKKGGQSYALLSGISLGWMFNIRPLSALPFIAIFTGIIFLLKKRNKKNTLIFFILGISLFFFLWLFYNYLTTGSIFISQYYSQSNNLFDIKNDNFVSFFMQRWDNILILFNSYVPMLFNLPLEIIIIPFLIPFLFKKNLWNNIFLVSIVSIPYVYFFYNGTFIMYGPRFWYETLPFVVLLIGRGISLLHELRPRVVLALCIFFALISLSRLIGIIPVKDPDFFSPVSLTHLKTFNYTDGRILLLTEKSNITNAVVFVKDTCKGQWWCYGSVFPQNSPDLNSNIVYAKDLGTQKNSELIKYYKNRSYYIIDYNTLLMKKLLQ